MRAHKIQMYWKHVHIINIVTIPKKIEEKAVYN